MSRERFRRLGTGAATELSRRELLRWAGLAGFGGLGSVLAACTDRPGQEIDDTPTAPRITQEGGTVSGTVTGLLTGRPAKNAKVTVQGVGTVRADFAGAFSIRVDRSGDFRLTVEAEDFLTRETAVRVTGSVNVVVTLIEADGRLTLEFLDQFARGLGPVVDGTRPRTPGRISRWLEPPRILLYLGVDGDPDTAVPAHRVARIRELIESVWFGLTGGAFGAAPAIQEVDASPPADRSQIPVGSLGFFQTADGSRGAGHSGRIDNPFAFANAHAFTGLEAAGGVVVRVLGQALGATFVEDGMPSVMNAEGRSTLTADDEQAATVLFNRPPGNGSPDTDPEGFLLNG